MTDWDTSTARAAASLRRDGFAGLALAVIILTFAPVTAGAHGFAAPFGWWFLLAFVLVALALSLHLLFDAALLRLAGSHPTEQAGLPAIDDVLARMGLRARQDKPAPLGVRLAGCRRLVWVQRGVLTLALLLLAILLLDGIEGGGA